RVEAERSVQVTSQGMGKCLKVAVEEGDRVEKGEILAQLDPAELNTQIASSKTQLSKTKADYARTRKAVEEGLSAQMDFDNAQFAYEQQQSNLEQLNVQLGN